MHFTSVDLKYSDINYQRKGVRNNERYSSKWDYARERDNRGVT